MRPIAVSSFPLRAAAIMIAVVAAGCGGSDRPRLVEATGLVTFEGQPLENATVVFAPVSGQRVATGKTNVDGEFILGTFGHEDGAILGEHQVTVVARDSVIRDESGGSSMPGGPTAPAVAPPIIPERYFAAETSGLTATVTEDGDNYFEFPLTNSKE